MQPIMKEYDVPLVWYGFIMFAYNVSLLGFSFFSEKIIARIGVRRIVLYTPIVLGVAYA